MIVERPRADMIATQQHPPRMRLVEHDCVLTNEMKRKLRPPTRMGRHHVVSIRSAVRSRVEQMMCRRKQFLTIIETYIRREHPAITHDKRLLFESRFPRCVESLVTHAPRIVRHKPAAVWSPLPQRLPQRGQVTQIVFTKRPIVEVEDGANRTHGFLSGQIRLNSR